MAVVWIAVQSDRGVWSERPVHLSGQLEADQDHLAVLLLHQEGLSYGEIARSLGIGKSTAFDRVQDALRQAQACPEHAGTAIPDARARAGADTAARRIPAAMGPRTGMSGHGDAGSDATGGSSVVGDGARDADPAGDHGSIVGLVGIRGAGGLCDGTAWRSGAGIGDARGCCREHPSMSGEVTGDLSMGGGAEA